MTTTRIERVEVNGAALGVGEMHDGVIYPSSDGEPMAENAYQFKAITDTAPALMTWFRDVSTVYVAGDMFIYYRRGDNTTRVAPDVFVVAGAKGNHPRQSWRVWAENAVPQFVLEVASESTWTHDAGDKRDIYKDMGVLEYWRFDPENGKYFREVLIGERLVDGEYVRMEVRRGADGILRGRSDFLGLDLCVRPDGQIRLYDPAACEWLLSHGEAVSERDDAARERDEATRRANMTARRAQEAARERDIANAALRERDAQLRESNAEIERLLAALRAARGER